MRNDLLSLLRKNDQKNYFLYLVKKTKKDE